MQIKSLQIKNFRSILNETVEFEPLTSIVGPNGAGKSALLRALNEFYSTSRTTGVDDFYNRDQSIPIEIGITFIDLTQQEKELFDPYIHGGALTVTKIIERDSERYHGTRRQNPDFAAIRKLQGKKERKTAYDELRSQDKYSDLPSVRSADEADEMMEQWEQQYPDKCKPIPDDGKFFGFRQVGQARLEKFTRFVLVPAVRDAEEDAADSKGSAIYQLMELVVRSALERNKKFASFRTKVQEEYASLLSPEAIPQLNELQTRLTSILQSYVPTAAVILKWITGDQVSLPMPRTQVRLLEDRFEAPVDRVGHGLQRAFILSLLQNLASTVGELAAPSESLTEKSESERVLLIPDLILGIEEPELYQHPNRQRHLSRILYQLSTGQIPGVAKRTQVIYCTHSPLFVDIARFKCVRRLQKVVHPENPELPFITNAHTADPDAIAKQLQSVQDPPSTKPFTTGSLTSRLATVMTPIVNEGFFGDVVALVEGEEDRAVLLGCSQLMGIDLEARGIAVIPCSGKTNIDKPFLVFSALKIPTYVMFDSDSDKGNDGHPEANRSLQRLLNSEPIVDFPQTIVTAGFAICDPNLSTLLKLKSGDDIYVAVAESFVKEYGYKCQDDCKKTPAFVKTLLENMAADGRTFDELTTIIQQLLRLVPSREAISVNSVEHEA